MRKRYKIAGALLAASAFATTAQAADIKIGVLYPITGGGAVYGVPAMLGNKMAIDEINAAGGINGQKVVAIERDTKLNPAEAAAAAKELITKDGVNVLIGGLSSGVGLAISEVAKQEKVLYIATIPKTIQMTTEKLHPYVFRTASHTDFEGDAIAQIVKKLGAKKICDIQLDYAYGHDLAEGIEKGLKKHAPDVQKVLDLRTKLGATDYNAVISQLIASDCEVVTSGLVGFALCELCAAGSAVRLLQEQEVRVRWRSREPGNRGQNGCGLSRQRMEQHLRTLVPQPNADA